MEVSEEILTTKDVAKMLKTNPNNIHQMVHRDQLPVRKHGKKLVFLRSEILEYIRNLPKRKKR